MTDKPESPQQTEARRQLETLVHGCVDVIRPEDLLARLAGALAKGRPLTVKVGFDPSSADIHLGHVVVMRKMKQFQDFGHRVVFVVGDFTAMIGDPTGRSKTRPQLTREQIVANAETYRRQAARVLDDAKTEFRYNGEWLDALGSVGLIKLAAKYNVARMLERRDFRQRFDAGQSIAVHEFLYPLAQAYDSVALRADVEMGGTDQLFNLNVGRDIMPEYELPPQIVMTTPLLEGLDGVEKMSKSLGNYVGVNDTPNEMFGKLMSVSDELMWKYWDLLGGVDAAALVAARAAVSAGVEGAGEAEARTVRGLLEKDAASSKTVSRDDAASGRRDPSSARGGEPEDARTDQAKNSARAIDLITAKGLPASLEALGAPSFHPKALKVALAKRIISDFHSRVAADAAEAEFAQIFTQRETPTEVEEVVRPLSEEACWLPKLLAELGLAKSNGEAIRLIQQGGVTIDGAKVDSKDFRLASAKPASYLMKVGKRRFVRVRFE